MTKEEGKTLVERLVHDFDMNEKYYLTKDFQETEVRTRFIDPFFSALGWDFSQTNVSKSEWDVHREYSQKDNSTTKKPDYAFRTKDGSKFKVKFFVEAKAPWVKLSDCDPVYQAKRYAFSSHGKTPIVILTDFQEFRVFNGFEKPIYTNPLQGLVKELDINYKDYAKKWDRIWELFSKESVYNGSIDTLTGKISKNTKSLDQEFLEDISEWREILARNIALRNKALKIDELNEAVQRIIDRFIFIRNLEDREIESESMLLSHTAIKEEVYQHLIPLFRKLDSDYNGLLFKSHFSENLIIDDKVIKDIIKKMCYPLSPYQFSEIEPEILGRIYEKFLGSKIRLTENHSAKIEEKPEVRHAGGVYYTPQYVVRNIVEKTVGIKAKGKDPNSITSVTICDPACGSGSFLLGAFDYLIDYLKYWYSTTSKTEQKKYKNDFYFTADGEIKITLRKKSEILQNCIYGVDIDREATEVAIMSLYLKLLDDGFDKGQVEMFMLGHILPDMTGNIKCGNSLIGKDYFKGQTLLSDEEYSKINPFDWNAIGIKDKTSSGYIGRGFPDILKNGGFDAIIGNPPYIDSETMTLFYKKERMYIAEKYKTATGNWDIYIPFIEKGLELLNEEGLCSFITPNKWLSIDYGKTLREGIFQNLLAIDDYSKIKVFQDASVFSIVFVLAKKGSDTVSISKVDRQLNSSSITVKKDIKFSNNFGLYLVHDYDIITKMLEMPNKIGAYSKISGAFTTSEAYELIPLILEQENTEEEVLKLINTGTIDAFFTYWGESSITYLKNKFIRPVVIKNVLKKAMPKRFEKQNQSKFIIKGIRHFKCIFDYKGEYLAGKSTTIITDISKEFDPIFVYALLNSKLVTYYLREYYSTSGMDGGINFSPDVISTIPLPDANKITTSILSELKSIVSFLDSNIQYLYLEKYSHNTKNKEKVLFGLNRIDDIIFELFSISASKAEEIKSIEYK